VDPKAPKENCDAVAAIGHGFARIPDHDLIRQIGSGSYGEVWLARNALGTYRAVKIVHRKTFANERPFEREFAGIQRFEPISRSKRDSSTSCKSEETTKRATSTM